MSVNLEDPDELLALALRGHEDWNAEMAEIEFGEIDFSNIVFPADMSFYKFEFPTRVRFDQATFNGVSFVEATFHRDAMFEDATFAKVDDPEHMDSFSKTNFMDGSVEFKKTTFGNNVVFFNATFACISLRFNDCVFKKSVYLADSKVTASIIFTDVTFRDDAHFSGTVFTNFVSFINSRFLEACVVVGTKFEQAPVLDDVTFSEVPDFQRTAFIGSLDLRNAKIPFNKSDERAWIFFEIAVSPLQAGRYRRLKELAVSAHDNASALNFFANELKSKIFHDAGFIESSLIFLYGVFSDFGRSVLRPFISLVFLWFVFSLIFGKNLPCKRCYLADFSDSFIFSLGNLVPFLTSTTGAVKTMKGKLFIEPADTWIYALSSLETGLGLVFLFLLGLGIRNNLRISA
ncbi:MAG: pentapeptide repeat-containing protein [Sneathiella sp.]